MLKNRLLMSLIFAIACCVFANNDSVAQDHSIVRSAKTPSLQTSSRLIRQDAQLTQTQDDQPSPSDLLQAEQDSDERDAEEKRMLDEEDKDDVKPQRQAFGSWPRKGIRGINVDIREKSFNVPEDRSEQLLYSGGSQWSSFASTPKVFAWVAPDIRYQPLYFEDVALERYGQTAGPYQQSALSAVHMFKSFVLLPHQMRHDAPGSCDSPLGFCRPGNQVPYTIQRTYFGQPGN